MAAAFKPWEYVAGDKTRIRVHGGATAKPKKMTGSRLGAVLGMNKWKSPFGAWCEIVRVAEEPFEGNKFTDAGTTIEPKLVEWCKTEVSPYIISPEEYFGKTAKEMWYDFFPENEIFGGMWDALVLDGKGGKPIGVIEAKTSSRPQDWVDGVPLSYAIQGLLYAYLLGLDRVFFPVAFLNPDDYDAPENFECTDDNTFLYELRVSEWWHDGRNFDHWFDAADDWYEEYVKGNISPQFDEKADKTFLDILRHNEVQCDDLEALAKEAAMLEAKIETTLSKASAKVKDDEKRLKVVKKALKEGITERFTETDSVVAAYGWQVKKSTVRKVDEDALKDDGLYEKYSYTEDTFKLTKTKG